MKQDHTHPNVSPDGSHQDRPYWRRAHRDWKVWVAIVLMLLAMFVYLRSEDLSIRPHHQQGQQVPMM